MTTIRVATVQDVAEIVDARNNDPNATDADRRTTRYVMGEHDPSFALKPRVLIFATLDDDIVGYIAGHLSTRFDCEGELQYLWVASENRRSGIATALVESLADWFATQDAKRVCVDVTPENEPARSFYRSTGATDLNSHWLVWDDMQKNSPDRNGRG